MQGPRTQTMSGLPEEGERGWGEGDKRNKNGDNCNSINTVKYN